MNINRYSLYKYEGVHSKYLISAHCYCKSKIEIYLPICKFYMYVYYMSCNSCKFVTYRYLSIYFIYRNCNLNYTVLLTLVKT